MIKTIALDAMGGDHGPKVVVPAGLQVLKKHPDLHIIFVGRQEAIAPILEQSSAGLASQWTIHHASEEVSMDESPTVALRNKKDSSMRVAINLVHSGNAQACVSSGNTGALMATSRFVLKTLPGIDRPAIITRFPTLHESQQVRILDLGANVDSSAEHLCQFAMMGSVFAQAVDNIPNPRIGLLNIGEETIKGNEQVKQTSQLLLQNKQINYIGYVEGNTLFEGVADVVVCDGFIGNVTLKAAEGVAHLIAHYAKQAFKQNFLTRLAALPALPVLAGLKKKVDPQRRNGAILLGLKGIVVKSHGRAGIIGFSAAIEEAILEIENNIPILIERGLKN
ncbi:MAG: phosphate acyltransferase PlsX [Proteobacteria bacterium]|nr:phosphate acyltransferase PlsX [Pseudomonadota bacterium]